METKLAANRIAERKLRDKQARRAQIISAARRIAELEGWSNVTVRRLSDEISTANPSCTLILEAAKEFSPRLLSRVSRRWAWLWRRHGNGLRVEIRSNRSRPHIWSLPRLHQHCMKRCFRST